MDAATMNETVKKNVDSYKNLLTTQDVDTIVQKSLGSKVSVISHIVIAHSDQVSGLMSDQRKLCVQVSCDDSATIETHTYFLKCVPYNNKLQAGYVQESKVFEREKFFYTSIIPHLMSNSKDKLWVAQCYLAKKDLLVLEDLHAKNYAPKELFLDVSSLKAALASLAKLHAASLLAEKQLGQTFLDYYPHLKNRVVFTPEGPFAAWVQAGIKLASDLADKVGLDRELVPKAFDLARKKALPSTRSMNTLCHGDVNKSNLMFNADSECTLVDFQLFYYAPAMVDVTQLIHLNASKQVRDKYETELLAHYHQVLCDTLGGGAVDCPKFEYLVDQYNEMREIGVATVNLYSPTNFLDSKLLVELVKSAKDFDELCGQDRRDVVFKFMEQDENYCRIMTSNITELFDVSF